MKTRRRLLEQALVGLVARERGGLEEALRLLRQVRERAAEGGLVHLRDQLLERLLARAVRQQVHHVLRVGDHGLGERRDAAVLEVQDAIRDVEDPVVVGHEQDRRALFLRQRLHPVDDLAARDAVERGGRLVGEHDGRIAHERPRDRDALPLAAREFVGALVDVRAEADRLEHRARAAPQLAAREAAGGPQPELDVLGRRERGEQVVLLEDEADAAAHALERARVGAVQFLAEHAHAARLRGAQRADQRQQRRLARARRPRDDDDLAGRDRGRHVEQDLAAQRALAVVVLESLDDDGLRGAHPNTSAGSSLRTLRNARNPDSAQTASMMPNTSSERSTVMCSGSRVAPAATRYR